MTYKQRLETKLTNAFQPSALEVIDESHQHHGHGGWQEGGETHFRLRLTSSAFAGLSRVEMHRRINAVVAEELKERVHALAIEAKAG